MTSRTYFLLSATLVALATACTHHNNIGTQGDASVAGSAGSNKDAASLLTTCSDGVVRAITAFPVPTGSPGIAELVAGPDGNIWFTEWSGNKIGRMTPTGETVEFPLPAAGSEPWGIVAGPDGRMWFAESVSNRIGSIGMDGTITEYPLPSAKCNPSGIAAGPDGNLWFTEVYCSTIGRITPAGAITEFAIPSPTSWPVGIVPGPGGNLWFTEDFANKVGRITPAGVITEFPLAAGQGFSGGIVAGPDGNLWFTEDSQNNKIGRITPAGTITEFPIPTANSHPYGIAPGPDGMLWFAEVLGNNVAWISPNGAITECPVPNGPTSIVAGPDGNMWFDLGNVQIGRMAAAGTPQNPNDAGSGEDATSDLGTDRGTDTLSGQISVPCTAVATALDYSTPASGAFSGVDINGYICTGGAIAFMERTQASSYVGSQLLVMIETALTGTPSSFLQFTTPAGATGGALDIMAGVGSAKPGVYSSSDGTSCGGLAFCAYLPLPPSVKCPDDSGGCPSPYCAMQGPISGLSCMPVTPETCYVAKAADSCVPDAQTPTGSWTLNLTSVTPYPTDAASGGMSFYVVHGTFVATMVEDQATVDAATVTANLAISF